MDINNRGGLQARVEPESGTDAAATIRPFERRLVMVAIFNRRQRLDKADALKRRPGGLRIAFLDSVHQTEVDWINSTLFGKFVYDSFRREGGIAGARRAIRCGL